MRSELSNQSSGATRKNIAAIYFVGATMLATFSRRLLFGFSEAYRPTIIVAEFHFYS